MTNKNDSVNPIIDSIGYVDFNGKQIYMSSPGLTKREYFAAMAMQGMLNGICGEGDFSYSNIAEESVAYANALIEALNK